MSFKVEQSVHLKAKLTGSPSNIFDCIFQRKFRTVRVTRNGEDKNIKTKLIFFLRFLISPCRSQMLGQKEKEKRKHKAKLGHK